MLFDVPLARIDKQLIELLLTQEVRESKTLDYKEHLPHLDPSIPDKRSEFVVDVAAMANGDGGVLVYGVSEKVEDGRTTGAPGRIEGLTKFSFDAETNRMRDILMSSLDPKLSPQAVEFHLVPGFSKGDVLIIKVHKSWVGPHMVAHLGKHRGRFYVRDGAANRHLDAQGIREAMLASANLGEKIEALAAERLEQCLQTRAYQLHEGPRMILHAIPASSAVGRISLDPIEMRSAWRSSQAWPLFNDGTSCAEAFNVDGFVARTPRHFDQCSTAGYVQMFRDGTIELGGAGGLRSQFHDNELRSPVMEEELIRTISAAMRLLPALGCEPPFAIYLTLTGANGYSHHGTRNGLGEASASEPHFDREVLRFPSLWLDRETLAQPTSTAVQPLLDAFWQGGGIERCPSYPEGKYVRSTAFDSVASTAMAESEVRTENTMATAPSSPP